MSLTPSPLQLGDSPVGNSRVPPERPNESDLAKITPFTTKTIAKRRAARVEAPKGTTYGESPALENENVMTAECNYELDFCAS